MEVIEGNICLHEHHNTINSTTAEAFGMFAEQPRATKKRAKVFYDLCVIFSFSLDIMPPPDELPELPLAGADPMSLVPANTQLCCTSVCAKAQLQSTHKADLVDVCKQKHGSKMRTQLSIATSA